MKRKVLAFINANHDIVYMLPPVEWKDPQKRGYRRMSKLDFEFDDNEAITETEKRDEEKCIG
jgi:hypothetical protein